MKIDDRVQFIGNPKEYAKPIQLNEVGTILNKIEDDNSTIYEVKLDSGDIIFIHSEDLKKSKK